MLVTLNNQCSYHKHVKEINKARDLAQEEEDCELHLNKVPTM